MSQFNQSAVKSRLAVAVILVLSSGTVAANATKDDAMASCDAAASAQKAAANVGMEWRDTGKIIKAGLALLEKGDFDGAKKKCDTGKFQGDAAVEQAKIEQGRWQARVPK